MIETLQHYADKDNSLNVLYSLTDASFDLRDRQRDLSWQMAPRFVTVNLFCLIFAADELPSESWELKSVANYPKGF